MKFFVVFQTLGRTLVSFTAFHNLVPANQQLINELLTDREAPKSWLINIVQNSVGVFTQWVRTSSIQQDIKKIAFEITITVANIKFGVEAFYFRQFSVIRITYLKQITVDTPVDVSTKFIYKHRRSYLRVCVILVGRLLLIFQAVLDVSIFKSNHV